MRATLSKRVLPLVAAGMLVSGCAAVKPGDESVARHEIDQEYVAAVERSARGMPVKIYWVNPPTREVKQDTSVKFNVDLPQD